MGDEFDALKKQYLEGKDQVDNDYQLAVEQYSDLMAQGTNLIMSLGEYRAIIQNSDLAPSRKNTFLSRVSAQESMLSNYVEQLQKIKSRVDDIKYRSDVSVNAALQSGSSGDVITATSDYTQLLKNLENSGKIIEDYQNLFRDSRIILGELSNSITKALPTDLSGLVFKKEDNPDANLKLLFSDPVVLVFLFVMFGLAVYYFAFMKFPVPGAHAPLAMPRMPRMPLAMPVAPPAMPVAPLAPPAMPPAPPAMPETGV